MDKRQGAKHRQNVAAAIAMAAPQHRPDPLTTKVDRARKDPVTTAIAVASELGVRFRPRGADLVVTGTGALSARDRTTLSELVLALTYRLLDDGADADRLLEELDVLVEVVVDAGRAQEVIAELPASVGLDVETTPLVEYAIPRPALVITRKGIPAVHQPAHKDPAGLDPHRARVRLIQVYDGRQQVYIFDLDHVPLEALDGLWSRKLVVHNAAFEVAMLGGRPVDVVDSMQLAGLALGCESGSRKLANVAAAVLGLDLSKTEQLSDWSAPRLSRSQLAYAAADAVVAQRAARRLWPMLGARERRAFELQNAVVPVVAGLRTRGVAFDVDVHRARVQAWELEHAEERERFRAITGEEPPARDKVGAWLEARLPASELAWMPRTERGVVSAQTRLLKHLAHHEEIRPLLRVLWSDKRLRAFGHKIVELINPVTGRLHPDYMACGAKSGRLTCTKPNIQQLPPDARQAVIASPGKALVGADYSQVELRVLAELAGDDALRGVFARGGDVHAEAAARIAGVPLEEVTPEQRKAAKAIVFGVMYGAGAKRLRASAWDSYGVDLTIEEAAAAKAALLDAFPGIREYQRDQADQAEHDGVLWSIAGRPLRAAWEGGDIDYTQAVNFAVQASATDVLLLAMANVDRALPGALVISLHDELVLEVPEDQAEEVCVLLPAYMAAAYSELFPGAPLQDLVTAKAGLSWGDLK
jgi:DNA polymerase I